MYEYNFREKKEVIIKNTRALYANWLQSNSQANEEKEILLANLYEQALINTESDTSTADSIAIIEANINALKEDDKQRKVEYKKIAKLKNFAAKRKTFKLAYYELINAIESGIVENVDALKIAIKFLMRHHRELLVMFYPCLDNNVVKTIVAVNELKYRAAETTNNKKKESLKTIISLIENGNYKDVSQEDLNTVSTARTGQAFKFLNPEQLSEASVSANSRERSGSHSSVISDTSTLSFGSSHSSISLNNVDLSEPIKVKFQSSLNEETIQIIARRVQELANNYIESWKNKNSEDGNVSPKSRSWGGFFSEISHVVSRAMHSETRLAESEVRAFVYNQLKNEALETLPFQFPDKNISEQKRKYSFYRYLRCFEQDPILAAIIREVNSEFKLSYDLDREGCRAEYENYKNNKAANFAGPNAGALRVRSQRERDSIFNANKVSQTADKLDEQKEDDASAVLSL